MGVASSAAVSVLVQRSAVRAMGVLQYDGGDIAHADGLSAVTVHAVILSPAVHASPRSAHHDVTRTSSGVYGSENAQRTPEEEPVGRALGDNVQLSASRGKRLQPMEERCSETVSRGSS